MFMAGVPGAGGPVPKREAQRRRENKTEPVTRGESLPAEIPEVDEDWHPVAIRWFESLKGSGQSVWYESSDWATAYLLAESISRELRPRVVGNTEDGEPVWASQPPTGAAMSAWLKGMTALLVTEGDRRRARIELQAGGSEEDDGVAWLEDARLRRESG